jgi:hypothetical protein
VTNLVRGDIKVDVEGVNENINRNECDDDDAELML